MEACSANLDSSGEVDQLAAERLTSSLTDFLQVAGACPSEQYTCSENLKIQLSGESMSLSALCCRRDSRETEWCNLTYGRL